MSGGEGMKNGLLWVSNVPGTPPLMATRLWPRTQNSFQMEPASVMTNAGL